MIAIFFGTVAVNAMNDYTGSLSLQAAGVRVPRPLSALVVGRAELHRHPLPVPGQLPATFENYLLFITYWIGPWAAIVLVDLSRRRRGTIDGSKAVHFGLLPTGMNALIALVVGFVVSIPFMDATMFVGPHRDRARRRGHRLRRRLHRGRRRLLGPRAVHEEHRRRDRVSPLPS